MVSSSALILNPVYLISFRLKLVIILSISISILSTLLDLFKGLVDPWALHFLLILFVT